MIQIAAQIDCAISCLAPTAFRPVLSSFQVCYLVRHFPVLNFDRLRLVLSLNMFRVRHLYTTDGRMVFLSPTNTVTALKGLLEALKI